MKGKETERQQRRKIKTHADEDGEKAGNMIKCLISQTQHIYSQLIHSWQHVSVPVNRLQANS